MNPPDDKKLTAHDSERPPPRDEKTVENVWKNANRANPLPDPVEQQLQPWTNHQSQRFWHWFLNTGEGRIFISALAISVPAYLSYEIYGGGGLYYWLAFPHSPLSLMRDLEFWRLITPAFIHFSFMHLLMNFLTFYWLLLSWPAQWSTPRLTVSLLCIAAASNLGQFFWAGPAFGGLSGLVFGLAGIYIGGVAMFRYRPVSVAVPVLSPPMIGMLLVMLVLGFANLIPGLADMAHLAGLLSGIVVGAALVLLSPAQQSAGQTF